MKILVLMLLCHIIDDFVLQPICLSKLKQREWWIEECKKKNLDIQPYQHDYLMALFIHAMSWSIMIHLPLIPLNQISNTLFGLSLLFNTIIHMVVDDLKANVNLINLWQDQLIHLIQITLTYFILN